MPAKQRLFPPTPLPPVRVCASLNCCSLPVPLFPEDLFFPERQGYLQTSLNLQFTAQNLSNDSCQNEDRDVFNFDLGNNPYNEYNRDWYMDIEKPAKGIFLCPRSGAAKGQVDQKGQSKKKQNSIKFIRHHCRK